MYSTILFLFAGKSFLTSFEELLIWVSLNMWIQSNLRGSDVETRGFPRSNCTCEIPAVTSLPHISRKWMKNRGVSVYLKELTKYLLFNLNENFPSSKFCNYIELSHDGGIGASLSSELARVKFYKPEFFIYTFIAERTTLTNRSVRAGILAVNNSWASMGCVFTCLRVPKDALLFTLG